MPTLEELYARQAEALAKLDREELRAVLDLFARSKRGLVGELLEYEGQPGLSRDAVGRTVQQLELAFRERIEYSITDAAVMGQDHITALGGIYRGALGQDLYAAAVSTTLRGVPEQVIRTAMQRVWADGLTLSDRIWRMSAYMKEHLENQIVIGISQGRTIAETAKEVSAVFDQVQDWQALRLVRTETMDAYREAYVQSGNRRDYVTSYDWVLSNAERNCDVCIGLAAGSPYQKDNVPKEGDTHPNCMCGVRANLMEPEQFADYLREKYAL
jgi:hypothetical protein